MQLLSIFARGWQKVDLGFGISRRAQRALSASMGGGRAAESYYSGRPKADELAERMNPVHVTPEPHVPGSKISGLLLVGEYTPGMQMSILQNMVRYRVDGVWLDDETNQPINMTVTHWIKADEKAKLS